LKARNVIILWDTCKMYWIGTMAPSSIPKK